MFFNIRKDNIKVGIITILILILTYILYLLFSSIGIINFDKSDKLSKSEKSYDRLISFGPSITETIYALGLGDNLVANTIYCERPEAAKSLPKIGSYNGINYELVLALNVDAVLFYRNFDREKQILENLGIDTIEVKQDTIDDIIKSISDLGSLFNKERESAMIIKDINDRLAVARCSSNDDVDDADKKRVAFIIYRDMDLSGITNITVAADDDYFNDMINRAGGINIFSDTSIPYPIVDREAMVRANPDIIIEVTQVGDDRELRLDQWYELEDINAVKNGNIYLFDASEVLTIGPRFIDTLETMMKLICSSN